MLFFLLWFLCMFSAAATENDCGCIAGRFRGTLNCTDCKVGQYRNGIDGNKSSSCTVCPAGFAQKYNGSSTCIQCAPGKFQDETGELTCKRCPVNQFTNIPKQTQCKKCWPGFSTENRPDPNKPLDPGMNWCVVCAAGKIANTTNTKKHNKYIEGVWGSNCIECKKGKYRAALNKTCFVNLLGVGVSQISQAPCNLMECGDCPIGWFNSRNGSDKCQICDAGKYNDEVGGEDCKDCRRGQYRNSSTKGGAESCFECLPGKYQSDPGRTACIQCPPGEYQPNATAITCTSCPHGYYGKHKKERRDACDPCLSGLYSNIEGRAEPREGSSTNCISCPSGYYNNEHAQSNCTMCQIGFYHKGDFKTSPDFQSTNWPCIKCGMTWEKNQTTGDYFPRNYPYGVRKTNEDGSPVGEFSGRGGAKECTNCSEGRFTANEGSAICPKCPAGYFQAKTGYTNCTHCPSGWYQNEPGLPSCKQCEMGKFINGTASSNCTHCPAGKFIDAPGKHECTECLSGVMNVSKFQNKGATSKSDCESLLRTCLANTEYLDDSSTNRNRWDCMPCRKKTRGTECNGFLKLSQDKLTHRHGFWTVPWWNDHENFQKCPFENSCGDSLTGCIEHTRGVMCAVCQNNTFRNTVGRCIPCTAGTVLERGGIVFICFAIVMIVLTTQRERCRRLKRKYGEAWRDILRIITIQVSYAQINQSLPLIVDIPWPVQYTDFLEYLSFVNVDVVAILGAECVGNVFWDYRARVGLACAVPLLILLLSFVLYHVRARGVHDRIARDQHCRAAAVEYMYDMVDTDQSEEIDVDEFAALMKKNKNDEPTFRKNIVQMMRDLGARQYRSANDVAFDDGGDKKGHDEGDLLLTKDEFIKAAASGTMTRVIGEKWIAMAESNRLRSSFSSGTLLVLFLLHAPVSQRLFYYFVCHNVGNCDPEAGEDECHRFLKVDFKIECGKGDHKGFAPFVWMMLFFFTFLLPFSVGLKLFLNRHRLYSVVIKSRLGFLYAPFNHGAEFWELHELSRKLLLTGILVFITDTAPRTATAILICATAVASLHYYRPHKNTIVFKVAQASFLLSTFKYVATLLIQHAIALDDLDDAVTRKTGAVTRKTQIGYVLIVLDVMFFLGSWIAGVSAIVLLRRTIVQSAKNHDHKIALMKEKRLSMAAVHPQNRDRRQDKSMDQVKCKGVLDQMQRLRSGPALNYNGIAFLNQVLTADKAHAAQKKHAMSRARKQMAVEKKKMHASQRLESRLLRRTKSKRIDNSNRLAGGDVGSALGEQTNTGTTSNPSPLNGNDNDARGAIKITDIKPSILKVVDNKEKLKKIMNKIVVNNDDLDHVSKENFKKLVKFCSRRVYKTVPTDTTTTACWNMVVSTSTITTGGSIRSVCLETWLFGAAKVVEVEDGDTA